MGARSLAATTGAIAATSPVEGSELPADDPRVILMQIGFYEHLMVCASSRKARAEELMQRAKARTWDAAKKAKMVRRLMTATQELEQSLAALDRLNVDVQRMKDAARANPTGIILGTLGPTNSV